ncbi:MAG: radical SAM protein [Deltaproteobacteria bacterium]|nr:radical SAM protein [Deltaproteobacteria bacterium]MBW2352693.1 radical SAM protein [Deltaproteobacteria bacterium]
MKLLLSSVFAPYGVDDEYGEKENKMELFHNQVTREQGIFSYRFNHGSQGLYFLAENIEMPTAVLDFPTFKRFKQELKKGYDYIGISFIIPNFKKAKEMARAIRELSPRSKIILGGHGVNIPNIELMIDHDFICRGEGVYFLRKLFSENVDKSIKHPLEYSSFNRQVMGAPWPPDSGILIPGVGCANKCPFCATSHFFGKYIPYLKTGQDIFEVCCRYEDEKGITDFGVLDENFLKMKDRALELLELMEKNDRHFNFAIFSSAETLKEIGDLDILVRMGVTFVWVGVESKRKIYAKNKNTDFRVLFKELKKRGISVLASLILFTEKHDKNTIWEDVDFVTSLNPDYVQFSPLGPIPGTRLYDDYEKQGKLIKNIPYESQHGQGKIWFHHDYFSRDESEDFLRLAFDTDYKRNGASMLRAIKTTLRGYGYCRNHTDERIRSRAENFEKRLKMTRYFLTASSIFVQNRQSKIVLREIKKLYRSQFGRMNLPTLVTSLIVVSFSIKEYLRCRIVGDLRVPKTSYRPLNKVYKHKDQPAEAPHAGWGKPEVPDRWIGQPEYSLVRSERAPSSWKK